MRTRVLSGIYGVVAWYLFMRCPNLDTMILACAALMVPAVWLEEIWEKITSARLASSDSAPRCPACGYDVRATPVRCPECGRVLDQSKAPWDGFSEGAVYGSITRPL